MLAELVLMCSPTVIFHSLWISASSQLSLRWNAEIIAASSRWFFMEVLSASFPGGAELMPQSSVSPLSEQPAEVRLTALTAPLWNVNHSMVLGEHRGLNGRTVIYVCFPAVFQCTLSAYQRLGCRREMEGKQSVFAYLMALPCAWGSLRR